MKRDLAFHHISQLAVKLLPFRQNSFLVTPFQSQNTLTKLILLLTKHVDEMNSKIELKYELSYWFHRTELTA